MTDDRARQAEIWQPRITGSLSVRWPEAGAEKIENVTARREYLRRRLAAMQAQADSLRAWQLQWDEAAKAYALAGLSREDLQDLHRSLQDAIDDLKDVGGRREEFDTMFENFDDKAQQLMNMLSQIMRNVEEMQSSTIRNML